MTTAIQIPAEMMEVLTSRMREIAQCSEAVEITKAMNMEQRHQWLFNAALYTLMGYQFEATDTNQ